MKRTHVPSTKVSDYLVYARMLTLNAAHSTVGAVDLAFLQVS